MATASSGETLRRSGEEGCVWPRQFLYNGCDWKTLRLCGTGTFSSCFHVCSGNGNEFALKVYKQDSKYVAAFVNELEVVEIIKEILPSQKEFSTFFVKYSECFTLFEHNCIMMELLGCNLEQLLIRVEMKRFSPYLIKKSLHDLLSAVVFLDGVDLVHGDIKPSNILWNMNSSCFQLIDFGLSFKIGKQPLQLLQSPGYQAPEVLKWNKTVASMLSSSQEIVHLLNTAMDMWSIACVVVYISSGQQLYTTEHAQQLPPICVNCTLNSGYCTHSKSLQNVLSLITTTFRSDDFKNLSNILSCLLQCHGNNRLSPRDALEHPFLANKFPKLDIVDLVLLPTKIIRLMNMFQTEDEAEKEDIICDIKEECEKLGHVISITASKKNNLDKDYHVYVEFMHVADSVKAQGVLTGRQFNDRLVVATYFPVSDYCAGCFY